MNTVRTIIFAMAIIAILGTASAQFLDIAKTDYVLGADSKDSRSLLISISVEWQSNISATSQNSANIRSMTGMAVIDEIRKYNYIDLEQNKGQIEKGIMSNMINKAQNIDITISDVKITKIGQKNELPDCTPQIVQVSYIPIWIYVIIIAAFILGCYVGYGNRPKKQSTD